MKLFVVLFALAAVALCESSLHSERLSFSFDNTDGVDDVLFSLPFTYGGYINVTLDGVTNSDVLLCLHWVVPVVAPFGENLDLGSIWDVTCTVYWNVTAGSPFVANDVVLRAGDYYFSAAVSNEDIDSTGLLSTSEYDFDVTITYLSCDAGNFGQDCATPFSSLSYENPTPVVVGVTPLYFALPSMNAMADTDTLDLFASSLEISFADTTIADAEFNLFYRLMGSPEPINDYAECRSSSSCKIENPPYTATPGYTWGISVSASVEVTTSLSVALNFCDQGTIGIDCEEYQTLDNAAVGEVKKFDKRTFFVFGSAVSVAVGGLDGYEEQDLGPPVKVQIDAAPIFDDNYDLLLSYGAQANVAIIDFSESSPDSKFVVSVAPSKSFGIWIVNDTTHCPNDCAEHGTCSFQEYVCVCDDKYEDLNCGHEIKDFTIEYIILIAVGSILILAILIGVPIYCYMNRNQEYDIVA